MIQWNQSTLATLRSLWTEDRSIGPPNKLGPEAMNSLRKCFDDWFSDIAQE